MKRNFKLSLLFALLLFAWDAGAQTLTITPTTVEVITPGAKSRAFYAIDDVFFTNTSAGGFKVQDASNGTILFSGDTSEVSVSLASNWDEAIDKLDSWTNMLPQSAEYPIYFMPRLGVNYIYKSAGTKLSIVNSRTKFVLWTGTIANFCNAGTSNALLDIRTRMFRTVLRAPNHVQVDTASISAGVSAGTSPTIAITDNFGTRGRIDLTAGSSPSDTGIVCTVTLPISFSQMNIQLTPRSSDGTIYYNKIWADKIGDNQFRIYSTSTGLDASKVYKWDFDVTGDIIRSVD